MTQGQITLESPFGRVLTELAREAKLIVEVGCWNGMGSTQCLLAGMDASNVTMPFLLTVEADQGLYKQAKQNLSGLGLPGSLTNKNGRLVHGVFHREILPYSHPINSIQHRETYEHEAAMIATAPLIHCTVSIDLLVLDGGEFTSEGDFKMLNDQARVIALDDTNPAVTVKNVRNRLYLLNNPDWDVLHDNPEDRHGWFVARRRKI